MGKDWTWKNTNALRKHYLFFNLNGLSKYIKVEGATLEDVFDYLFDVGAEKFLWKKWNKYLHEIFEKWDSDHLELDEDFDDYLDNNGLKDIIGDEGIQNLNMDD